MKGDFMEYNKDFAHIYDELINPDIDYEKWAQYIYSTCANYGVKFDKYLDLACGTGNLTENMCTKFKDVWAVDISEDMLCEAEEKFRNKGFRARFICQDISKLNLNMKFNLITCCLDSTNYITSERDLKSYFSQVEELLEDEGLFVFDVNSYYKLTKILGNNTFDFDNDDVVYVWENSLEDNIVSMYLMFFIKKEGNAYVRFDEEHQERAYTEEQLERYLDEAGLSVIKKVDCYEERNISNITERITYIVKKSN